mmetsp:Transcript_73242/g.194621  ORF Transcript_73242/g.194621 Transcript_73242/m.194621 type:complete len:353 (+) Transcript_73242:194-1252(+)
MVALHDLDDLREELLLELWLVEAGEVAHLRQHAGVKSAGGPVLPHLDHLLLVEVLLAHVPSVDREVKLWHASVLELVLIVQLEVGTHHGQEHVRPIRLVEDHLAGPGEVARVPVHELLLDLVVAHALAPVPRPHGHRHVGRRESVEERRLGHGEATLADKEKPLQRDPRADRMAPDEVGNAVRHLVQDNRQELWGERVGGGVRFHVLELVSAWEVNRQDLDVARLLHPFSEGRLWPSVVALGTACVVEAENAQLAVVERELEDLVLHDVLVELVLQLDVVGLNLLLQLLVNLHWPGLTGGPDLHLLLLRHGQLLAADLDADPALGGARAGAFDKLVVQPLTHKLNLFHGGAR